MGTIQEVKSKLQIFKVSNFPIWEIPKLQSFKVPETRFQESSIPRFQDSNISQFPNFKFPRFQDSQISRIGFINFIFENVDFLNDYRLALVICSNSVYSNSEIRALTSPTNSKIMKIEVFGTTIHQIWIWPRGAEKSHCQFPQKYKLNSTSFHEISFPHTSTKRKL